MKKLFWLLISAFLIVVSAACAAQNEKSSKDDEAAQQAFKAYVEAWKNKDIASLQRLIADDYMALNSENKVSSKEIELATAKADPIWNQMTVDEIHTHIIGNTAVASGLISAEGKRPDGTVFNAKARFLAMLVKRAGKWQLLATESASAKH